MKCSIIIVNYNGFQFTKNCVESIYQHTHAQSFEIIIVDNNSTDNSRRDLPELFPDLLFVPLNENRGFGAANNEGAKRSSGDLLFFLNNDTVITSDVVKELSSVVESEQNVGIAAPKLLNSDGTFQRSFGEFPDIITEMRAKKTSRDPMAISMLEPKTGQMMHKEWVTGAAMMVRRTIFEEIGGFDEHFFMYFEDSDLCRRLTLKGYSIVYFPGVSLIHFGGSSYSKENRKIEFEYRKSQKYYYFKHHSALQRFILTVYIVLKYLPLMFNGNNRSRALNIIRLSVTKR